jgi:hypothetical protein
MVSIYPWEINKDGIDFILDNITGIAGINSVQMLVVMHQEHRLLKTIKDTKAISRIFES